MKKALVLMAAFAIIGLLATQVSAAPGDYANTLYGQEGTAADGYGAINATGHGPAGPSANYLNWKWQSGSGAVSEVYSWDGDAWLVISQTGDEAIEVEADIEMFWSETTANNKIYFHIGNPSTLSDNDRLAYVSGTYAGNHPMYVGISFEGTSKNAGSFELATGTVKDGMVGSVDNHGTVITDQKFDISFCLSINGGPCIYPTSFGDGAHGTEPACLWWSPTATDMINQLHGYMVWCVTIHPKIDQADGNYALDPVLVSAPVL
ncbi:MAG: hypothetical protein NTW86_25450 [Candidatus Sumerlaeota bacterium]|nr:hypothetical protein [Candidatus Sumerlaeota bacterium]